jgi:hypothetical protein
MLREPCRAKSGYAIVRWIAGCLLLTLAVAGDLRGSDDPLGTTGGTSRDRVGREPPHRTMKRFEIGVGPRSYWLFEPAEPSPEGRAPVVVFLHGWFAVNPGFYGAWIDHLVRDGRIVIFPRYQNDVGTMPQDFLPNAVAAIHDALGV